MKKPHGANDRKRNMCVMCCLLTKKINEWIAAKQQNTRNSPRLKPKALFMKDTLRAGGTLDLTKAWVDGERKSYRLQS